MLVAHDGAGAPLLRLSCPQGRVEVEAGPGDGTLGWPPSCSSRRPSTTAHRWLAQHGDPAGRGGRRSEGVATPYDGWPWPSTLRDLFVVERIREALRSSAVERRWVETA